MKVPADIGYDQLLDPEVARNYVDREYCRRIACGEITQAEAGPLDLFACSSAFGASVLTGCERRLAPGVVADAAIVETEAPPVEAPRLWPGLAREAREVIRREVSLPAPWSNPMAPPWRLESFSAKLCEIPWVYERTYTVAANTTNSNNRFQISSDADFILDELGFDSGAVSVLLVEIRIKDGDGRRLSPDLDLIDEIQGPVVPPLTLLAGRDCFIDIRNNAPATSLTLRVQFKGRKRYRQVYSTGPVAGFEPAVYVPLRRRYSQAPEGYRDEGFELYIEFALTANQVLRSQPIIADPDATFYLRGLVGHINDIESPGRCRVRLTDPFGMRLSSDLLFFESAFGRAPVAKPIYPEIVCPPQSALLLDIEEYFGDVVTPRMSLTGVKRVKQ